MVAQALQPALFVISAVSSSDKYASEQRIPFRRGLICALLYVPGIFLLGLQYRAIHFWSATVVLLHRLDQISLGYLALYYVVAAIVFRFRYRHAESGLERQQLKGLTRGTLLALVPFTVLNVIPYLADSAVPGSLTKLARLSLAILPLTFSWTIVRYRLMDVDLIFKRGVTYTLATALLVGVYFGVVAVHSDSRHSRLAP